MAACVLAVAVPVQAAPVSRSTYAVASWFGPGLYGNHVACSGRNGLSSSLRLYSWTVGVANKYLPCGTWLTICYHGRCAVAQVIDRGPYWGNREFDLTEALANMIGMRSAGVGSITWAYR